MIFFNPSFNVCKLGGHSMMARNVKNKLGNRLPTKDYNTIVFLSDIIPFGYEGINVITLGHQD